MSLKNDLYSVTIIDTITKDYEEEEVNRKLRNSLVDYFNIGINEYRYPEDSPLGDIVQSTIKDLNVTDSGLTSIPYKELDEGLNDSQAIFIVGDLYTKKVDSLVNRYHGDYYIDFVQV